MGAQDGTVICSAEGSSVYHNAGFFGDYNPYLAVDGKLSPGNSGFYHSSLESYPYLKIVLRNPDGSRRDTSNTIGRPLESI